MRLMMEYHHIWQLQISRTSIKTYKLHVVNINITPRTWETSKEAFPKKNSSIKSSQFQQKFTAAN